MRSIRSRVSRATTRASQAPSLAQINEAENVKKGCCDVCSKDIMEDEDMAMNEDIST